MLVETKIFEVYRGAYPNLTELAGAMGISVSQIYRVRRGERKINHKFIVGALRAFPAAKFDDSFYVSPENDRSLQLSMLTARKTIR